MHNCGEEHQDIIWCILSLMRNLDYFWKLDVAVKVSGPLDHTKFTALHELLAHV